MIIERRLKPNIMVDLTPLIDVVFQLVIFFMISSTFKTAPGIDLTLPDSSTAAVITVAELTVSATAAGDVYINKVLTNALQVSLSADSDVPYQVIVQLLDALRQNGIDAVGLVTNQPRPEAP